MSARTLIRIRSRKTVGPRGSPPQEKTVLWHDLAVARFQSAGIARIRPERDTEVAVMGMTHAAHTTSEVWGLEQLRQRDDVEVIDLMEYLPGG